MKVLVTGGSGFIGRNLVEGLGPGFTVHAPTSQELDLCDPAALDAWLEAHGPYEAVLHTATHNATRTSHRDVAEVLDRNLRLYFNLVRRDDAWGRLVNFGSGACYDRRAAPERVEESYFGRHLPADDYGLSKHVIARHAERHPRVVELRVFGCYGPHEDWRIRFISNALCKALCDLPITLRQDVAFDYLWVEDLVEITRRTLRDPLPAGAYNACTGAPIRLAELAALVLEVTGRDLPVHIAQEGLGRPYTGNNARLLAAMPGLQLTPHRAAITRLAAWYAARLHTLPREALLVDP